MLAAALLMLAPNTLYVGPQGLDDSPGTAQKPLATLAEGVRRLRQSKGPRRLVVQAGRYRLERGLQLSEADSGLTIEGEGRVVVSGAVELPNPRTWREGDSRRVPAEMRKAVRVADLSRWASPELTKWQVRGFMAGGRLAHGELFSNGRRLPVAQWPNGAEWARTGAVEGDRAFAFSDPRAAGWGPGGWTLGYWVFDWAEAYLPIATSSGGKITLGEAPPQFGIGPGRRWKAMNLPEELDAPGEWWLDPATSRLYVIPEEKPGRLTFSLLGEPLLSGSKVSDFTVRGITFEGTRSSGIVFEGSRVTIDRCVVRSVGQSAIYLNQADGSSVRRCLLEQLGEAGVMLNAGDRLTLRPGGGTIEDSEVRDYGQWVRTYQAGASVDGVGNVIRRCFIHDAPHNAIHLTGNDHLIQGNRIAGVCRETGDAGAIYMGQNITMRGNRIVGNLIEDMSESVRTEGNFPNVIGIYLDDCFSGTTVEGNILDLRGEGVLVGGGRDNRVVGNLFLRNKVAVSVDQRALGWAKSLFWDRQGGWYIFHEVDEVKGGEGIYAQRYPTLAAALKGKTLDHAEGNLLQDNVIVGTADWLRLSDGITREKLEDRGNQWLADATLAQALRLMKPEYAPKTLPWRTAPPGFPDK